MDMHRLHYKIGLEILKSGHVHRDFEWGIKMSESGKYVIRLARKSLADNEAPNQPAHPHSLI